MKCHLKIWHFIKMPSCDFCHSDFNDKSTLNRHQRTSKKCIKIQEQQNPGKAIEKTIFKCDYCKKELSRAHTLKGHLIICKTKLKQEKIKNDELSNIKDKLEQDKNELSDLKEKLEYMEKEVESLKEKLIIPNIIIHDIVDTPIYKEIMSASEMGFELERLIHEESTRLGAVCRRECDIRKELNDTSLNGVDHWISKGNVHILIQDKWKKATTQPEISQFLICAHRIKNQLPKEASINLLWVAKTEPTSYGKIILKEEKVHMIINSRSIKSLSRQVYAHIGDVFDEYDNSNIDK